MMTPVLLPRRDAAQYAGMSPSTLEKLVRLGQFPAPRKLSPGRVGWLRREVDEWAEKLPVSDLPPGPQAARSVE